MLDINGRWTIVAKGERLLGFRSGKWKKLSVAEVAYSCFHNRWRTGTSGPIFFFFKSAKW